MKNLKTSGKQGIISAASIVSEFNGFSNFNNSNQLLSFAGLEPSIYESGTQTTYGHLVKRGSSYLRETLMNVAPFVMNYNNIFYQYYLKKRNEGKHHRVALTHLVKKLLRVIYYLETNPSLPLENTKKSLILKFLSQKN